MARVEPRTFALDQLIEEVRGGRLRVPRFQRIFVWRYEQVRSLFTSLAQSYPVGSLLIWSTPDRYRSFEALGPIGLPIDQPPEPTEVGYLLDGHQRVSAIVGVLSLSDEEADRVSGQARAFLLYYDLDKEEFVHERAPKEKHLPARYLLAKGTVLNRWMDERRDATLPGTPQRVRWDRNRERGFALQTTFAQYRLPYLDVTKADLTEAIRIFVLLNTAGTRAKKHEVFAAMSWKQDGFDFGRAARGLLDVYPQYGNFGTGPVLQALLVSLGESSYEDDWQAVEEKHGDALERAFEAVAEAFGSAIAFVDETFGASSGKVLPYSLHLVLLTEFFRLSPDPSPQQVDQLTHWFWASSFSRAYSAATNIVVDAAVASMRGLANGDLTALTDPTALFTPTPGTFHPKSARVRATYLFLKTRQPRDLEDGQPFPPDLLSGGMSDGESIAGRTRSNWRMAGRILVPHQRRRQVSEALENLPKHRLCDEILESHIIPPEALHALLEGDEEAFLDLREVALVDAERLFAARFVQVLDNGSDVDPEPVIDVEDEEAPDFL